MPVSTALQIIETRIISVISWCDLAFFVISIAMFDLTAGAVFVYLWRERFRPEQLSYDLTAATLAFALTTNLAILVQLTLVTGASPSLTSLVAWAEFALSLGAQLVCTHTTLFRCHPDEPDRYLGGDGRRRLHAH